MFMSDKKKPASVILASMGKPMESSPDNVVVEDEGRKSAGEELIAAVQSGDASAVMDALEAAIELCQSEPEEASEAE